LNLPPGMATMSKATELPSIFWVKLAALGASSARPVVTRAVKAPITVSANEPARQPQATEPIRVEEKLRM